MFDVVLLQVVHQVGTIALILKRPERGQFEKLDFNHRHLNTIMIFPNTAAFYVEKGKAEWLQDGWERADEEKEKSLWFFLWAKKINIFRSKRFLRLKLYEPARPNVGEGNFIQHKLY